MSGARADDPKPDKPEPPVKLQKKDKPKAAEDKPADKDRPADKDKKLELRKEKDKDKAKDDDDLQDPEQDPKEILGRVSKNMRNSEENLSTDKGRSPKLGENTRQLQDDILKDLDALIKQTKRQQQQQQQEQNQQQSGSSKNQRDKQQGGSGRGQKKQPGDQSAGGKKPSQGSQPKESSANQGGGGGKSAKGDKDKGSDTYKDIWGHLPETLRQEMDAYAKEKFMVRYSDLIKQYYATLAEKGRKKEQ